MALEKNKKDYLKPPAAGSLARALNIKINIKMEICISEQADHDLLRSRSIFPAPVCGSNVPSQVPISKLDLC